MNKYLTLLLLSTLLYSSCKKDPKVAPNESTEPETEQEADPVMFSRKNYDGDFFFTSKCNDGNIVGIGTEIGNSDGTLRKVSATDGSVIWDKPLAMTGGGYLDQVQEMPNGDIWTMVHNFSNAITIAAYDRTGNHLWTKGYPIGMHESTMIPIGNDEVLVVGVGTLLSSQTIRRAFAVRVNNNGDTLSVLSQAVGNFTMTDAIRTSKGMILVTGNEYNSSQTKMLVLDEHFALLTEKTLSTEGKHIECMTELDNGDVVCAGAPQYPASGDGFVMHMNSSLQLLETHVYHNDTLPTTFFSIVKTKTGYALAGTLGGGGFGKYAFVASVDIADNIKRQKLFPRVDNNGREYISGIHNNGSGYLLVGTVAPGMHYKYFIATLNKELEGTWQ